MQVQLGDLAEWLAAVGTVGALFTVLFQIRSERRVRVARDDQDREQRRRFQAQLISAWPGPEVHVPPSESERESHVLTGRSHIRLLNASSEPVYNLVACIIWIQGAGYATAEDAIKSRSERKPYNGGPWMTVSLLPPGRWQVWVAGTGWATGLGGRPGIDVAFTDRAGNHWIRRGRGALEELPIDALNYFGDFGLHGPHQFQLPEEA